MAVYLIVSNNFINRMAPIDRISSEDSLADEIFECIYSIQRPQSAFGCTLYFTGKAYECKALYLQNLCCSHWRALKQQNLQNVTFGNFANLLYFQSQSNHAHWSLVEALFRWKKNGVAWIKLFSHYSFLYCSLVLFSLYLLLMHTCL